MYALDAKEGFKFGCDPELFVFNPDGKPVPVSDFLPGTKDEPYRVDYGAVQVDGFAAEFNIDPVTNFRDWNRNISVVLKQLEGFLPSGHTLQAIPAVTFDEDVFINASDQSKELGCSPDFDAWTGEINPPPVDLENPFLRTAAGHIHFGWTEDAEPTDAQHVMNCRDLVKQLDWYLGGWSLRADTDPTRRRLYGRAGACRLKSYGVEYRVLSNFWIISRDRRLAVWNRMQTAIAKMSQGFVPDRAGADNNARLINAINDTTVDAALFKTFRYPLSGLNANPFVINTGDTLEALNYG